MKRTNTKKLVLGSETLLALQPAALEAAQGGNAAVTGGLSTHPRICPATTTQTTTSLYRCG
jgi:hypothetical protein